MHLIKHSEDFEKYLHYMVGQAQAEACVADKAAQQYFNVFSFNATNVVDVMVTEIVILNALLIVFQELTESGKPDTAMDVLTFLRRPVERIQTYQALLKVNIQFKQQQNFYFVYFWKTIEM